MSEAAAQSRGSYLADHTKKDTRQDIRCCQVSLRFCFISIQKIVLKTILTRSCFLIWFSSSALKVH